MIGAVLGDGCTKYKTQQRYAVVLSVRDYEFASEFGRCLAVALSRDKPFKPHWERSTSRWCVMGLSKPLYILLKEKDINQLRPFIEHSPDCIKAFIRGMADAEGSVSNNIQITNTRKDLIDYIADLLNRIGINSRISSAKMDRTLVKDGKIYMRNYITLYNLVISRKNDMRRYAELIGFAIPRKQRKLEELLGPPLPSSSTNFGRGSA